jgi:hypothetical protein
MGRGLRACNEDFMPFRRRVRTYEVHHATPPAQTSHRLDPQVANAARHGDVPDGNTYDRPATTRIAPANLALSIAVLIVAAVLALLLLWIVF